MCELLSKFQKVQYTHTAPPADHDLSNLIRKLLPIYSGLMHFYLICKSDHSMKIFFPG